MRVFGVACLALVGILVPVEGTAFGQEIKISHQWAQGTAGRDRATRVFVQEAEARAKGLKFRIHPNSSLNIKPGELLNAMQNNALEMAVYPLVYAAGKVPEFSLAGLPGLVPNLEAAQVLKGSEIHTTLQSIAEANGIRILTWWWAPGGFLAKNREISDPRSVQGLKMRAAEPLLELMLKVAGASVTSMPSTGIYAGMQSGSLDAILTTYETFVSLRLYEQAKFATVGSPSLFMGFSPLVMSLTTWKRLTPEQKAALEEAAAISDLYFDAGQRDVERRMVTTLRSAGVTISRMKINPRAQELLLTTIRTHLEKLGSKEDLIESIHGDEPR